MQKYLQVTGMTKREYNVEAHFRVPYATTVVAESAEEAEEKAEKLAKNFSKTFNQILQHGYKDYSDQPSAGWSMTCDEVILQIDLTYQVNTCMRPFIRDFDD